MPIFIAQTLGLEAKHAKKCIIGMAKTPCFRPADVLGDGVHRAGELGVTLDGGGVDVELGRHFLGGSLRFRFKGRIVRPLT